MTFSALEKNFKMWEINLHMELQNSNTAPATRTFWAGSGEDGAWFVRHSGRGLKFHNTGNPLVKLPLWLPKMNEKQLKFTREFLSKPFQKSICF